MITKKECTPARLEGQGNITTLFLEIIRQTRDFIWANFRL